MTDETYVWPEIGSPEREAHLFQIGQWVLERRLFTWAMPADWGLNFGIDRMGGKWEKCNTSAEEILSLFSDIPRPDREADEEWSDEARQYARGLWIDLRIFFRDRVRLAVLP